MKGCCWQLGFCVASTEGGRVGGGGRGVSECTVDVLLWDPSRVFRASNTLTHARTTHAHTQRNAHTLTTHHARTHARTHHAHFFHFVSVLLVSTLIYLAGLPEKDSTIVFFEIEIGGCTTGRVEIELKTAACPRTAENFKQLCK